MRKATRFVHAAWLALAFAQLVGSHCDAGEVVRIRRINQLKKQAHKVAKLHLRHREEGFFVVTLTEDILLAGSPVFQAFRYGAGPSRLKWKGRRHRIVTLRSQHLADGKREAEQLIANHLLKYLLAGDVPPPNALDSPRLDFIIYGPYPTRAAAQRAVEKLRFPLGRRGP